jgi:hypothetical protein
VDDIQDGSQVKIYAYPFVIDDRTFCFWDRGDSPFQQAFLSGLDPEYFDYVARSHLANLEGQHSLQAALAIRIAYSHALETLFSLLSAALQAPDAPAAWMQKYQVKDVVSLVRKIQEGDDFSNRLRLERPSWSDIAKVLIPSGGNEIDWEGLRSASTRLWQFLAHDILDKPFEAEYDSAKHGLRVRSGGWFLAMGREETPGVPAPPENMRLMGSSKFGTTFLKEARFAKHNYVLGDQRVNWQPEDLARRIGLIAASTSNVINFLKHWHDLPEDDLFIIPFTEEDVTEMISAAYSGDAIRFSIRSMFSTDNLVPLTAEEVQQSYDSGDLQDSQDAK